MFLTAFLMATLTLTSITNALLYALNVSVMVFRHKLYSTGNAGLFISAIATTYCATLAYMMLWMLVTQTRVVVVTGIGYALYRRLKPMPPPPVVHPSEATRPVMTKPSLAKANPNPISMSLK
jgi:hypothetical protein